MELKQLLGKAAPWLAAAASGPAGLALQALKIAADALGAADATQDGVVQALAGASPEQLQALRRAELEFKVRMQSIGHRTLTDLERIAADDRKDARDAAVRGGTLPWVTGFAMALVFVAIGCEMAVLLRGYGDAVPDVMVGRILGFIDSLGMMGAGFLLGTTVNSARKTDFLAQAEPIR